MVLHRKEELLRKKEEQLRRKEEQLRWEKQRLYELRRHPSVKAGKKAVIEKHASRKTTPASSATSRLSKENTRQLGWDFF